ncbi:MAG: hypothetical protein HGB26_01255 [Desulfobulbaceae bacterium]|nr:hypothetical protein [Desulfobulbaceae bacterium]
MPDLLELVNYSLVNYRSILCGKITESMVGVPFDSVNEANKELFNAISLGLPVREEDVRKTGSHSAMNLLQLDALEKRLDELMICEIPAKLTGEPAADVPQERKFIHWRGTPEELTQLADLLFKSLYINSAKWFIERFEKDCPNTVGVIGQKNHIVYLFEQLRNKKKIQATTNGIIEQCFGFSKGSFKSIKNQYETNNTHKPKRATNIDTILCDVFSDPAKS